jgi:hypothetical protein
MVRTANELYFSWIVRNSSSHQTMPKPGSDHPLLTLFFAWRQRPKPLPKPFECAEKSIVMSLDHRILKDILLEITNHDFLDYLPPPVSHPDASLDLRLLMENKMGRLTSYQLHDLIEDLYLGSIRFVESDRQIL